MWIVFTLVSSLLLGIYDIFKKASLKNNEVLGVLFVGTFSGAALFIILLIISRTTGSVLGEQLYIPVISPGDHLLYATKSLIVGSSWVFAFYGLKHLPITIVTPIRSTAPAWTILGAVIIFSEDINKMQWVGIVITIGFFYLFSIVGKKEGISFRKNKWVWFIVFATLIGAGSGLYDKFLLQTHHRLAVQTWFLIYLTPMLFIAMLVQRKLRKEKIPFRFTWAIPMIGITLALADYAYFYALSEEGSMISIISSLRRSSVLYSFFLGAAIFKDKNIRKKWPVLVGILVGVLIIVLATEK